MGQLTKEQFQFLKKSYTVVLLDDIEHKLRKPFLRHCIGGYYCETIEGEILNVEQYSNLFWAHHKFPDKSLREIFGNDVKIVRSR